MKSRYFRIGVTLVAATALTVCAAAQNQNGNSQGQNGQGQNVQGDQNNQDPQTAVHQTNPHGAGVKTAPPAGLPGLMTPVITSHGSAVINSPVMYYIWYGNWNQSNNSDTPAGQQILRDLATGIGSSPYFAINTSYPGVSGSVTLGKEYTDTGSQGSSLSNSAIQRIVINAINKGGLPFNPNGVYFVLTSSNISQGNFFNGFCSAYCGWHTSIAVTANGVPSRLRYAFVGNANRFLNACAIQSTSPNNNPGVDGMASVVAHELEESTTDPDLNNWYDSNGAENGDKCAWTFGASGAGGSVQLSPANNGSYYNMTLNNRPFLIQRNLSSSSYCYVNWLTKAQ